MHRAPDLARTAMRARAEETTARRRTFSEPSRHIEWTAACHTAQTWISHCRVVCVLPYGSFWQAGARAAAAVYDVAGALDAVVRPRVREGVSWDKVPGPCRTFSERSSTLNATAACHTQL